MNPIRDNKVGILLQTIQDRDSIVRKLLRPIQGLDTAFLVNDCFLSMVMKAMLVSTNEMLNKPNMLNECVVILT